MSFYFAEKAQRNLSGQKRDDVMAAVAQEEAIAALKLLLPPAKLLLPVASAVPTDRASGNAVRYQEACSISSIRLNPDLLCLRV